MTSRKIRGSCRGRETASSARAEDREAGATLVEFALIIPIFALLLFATIDFGMSFGGYITLRNGVDAAARLASVSQIDSSCTSASDPMICTIKARVGNAFSGIESGNIQVNYSFPGGQQAGDVIKVCAVATLKSTTGFTAPFINGKTITATSSVRLEQNPGWTENPPGSPSC